MHVDVADMILQCATMEGVPAPEWISNWLRPILEEKLIKSAEKILKTKKKRDDA